MISTCLAESVGSIMSLAMKRGRNTHPVNFEKEIKLRFNLPLHILNKNFIPDLVEEIVVVKGKEYFRKGDSITQRSRMFKYTTAYLPKVGSLGSQTAEGIEGKR